MKHKNLIFGSILLAATTACRDETNHSSTQTLDNLAAGKTVQVNECGAPETHLRDAGTQPMETLLAHDLPEKSLRIVRNTLSAVPYTVQKRLATVQGLKIHLSDAIPYSCQASGVSEDEMSGCYVTNASTTSSQFEVYIRPSEAAIRHALVQTIAMLYLKEIPRHDQEGEILRPKKEISSAWATTRLTALDAYLKDTGKSVQLSTSDTRNLDFADLVLTHAFDSYYCDVRPGKSRDVFKQKFPRLYDLWEKIALDMEKTPSASGFALQGGSFYAFPAGSPYHPGAATAYPQGTAPVSLPYTGSHALPGGYVQNQFGGTGGFPGVMSQPFYNPQMAQAIGANSRPINIPWSYQSLGSSSTTANFAPNFLGD